MGFLDWQPTSYSVVLHGGGGGCAVLSLPSSLKQNLCWSHWEFCLSMECRMEPKLFQQYSVCWSWTVCFSLHALLQCFRQLQLLHFKRNIAQTEEVQRKATMIKRKKKPLLEERLKYLSQLNLEKRWVREHETMNGIDKVNLVFLGLHNFFNSSVS